MLRSTTRPTAHLLILAMLCALLAGPATAAVRCGGKNILAEIAETEPGLHAEIMSKAAATANATALLWRIDKAGVQPSYLFGTVHMTDDRVTVLSPKLVAALDASREVALEIADLSPAATAAAMASQTALLLDPSGSRLTTDLSAQELAQVRSVLTKSGMPPEIVTLVRPWLVYMMLALSDCERSRVASGLAVLDMRLAEEGRKRGLPVIGLETLESQLQAMASIPDAQQIEMLRTSLKFIERTDDLMETMVQMYLGRQMGAALPLNQAIARKAGVSADAFKGFESELVVRRNHRMRDAALPMIGRGGAFIGVGALHLVGNDGLVELFRNEGYTLTAVE